MERDRPSRSPARENENRRTSSYDGEEEDDGGSEGDDRMRRESREAGRERSKSQERRRHQVRNKYRRAGTERTDRERDPAKVGETGRNKSSTETVQNPKGNRRGGVSEAPGPRSIRSGLLYRKEQRSNDMSGNKRSQSGAHCSQRTTGKLQRSSSSGNLIASSKVARTQRLVHEKGHFSDDEDSAFEPFGGKIQPSYAYEHYDNLRYGYSPSSPREKRSPRTVVPSSIAPMPTPVKLSGWMKKHGGAGHRFRNAKRRWFVLEWPYLSYYSQRVDPTNLLQKPPEPKGSISLKGACMVDGKLKGEPKHRVHVGTRFKINSARKEFILEVESPEEKKRWVDALWSNIYYSNPAKREGGVCYDVLVNDEKIKVLRIDLTGLSLLSRTGDETWGIPITTLQYLDADASDPHRLTLHTADGEKLRLKFLSVPASVAHSCICGISATELAWRESVGVLPDTWDV